MNIKDAIKPGVYKHYKGRLYVVMFLATDTTNGKDVVVYTDGTNNYTRPVSEWFETTKADNTPRFTRIGNEETEKKED